MGVCSSLVNISFIHPSFLCFITAKHWDLHKMRGVLVLKVCNSKHLGCLAKEGVKLCLSHIQKH